MSANSCTSSSQKLRRNASPSTKQGPIRATRQFGLASPSRSQSRTSPSASPGPKDGTKVRHRPLSETCILLERRSPSSPSSNQKAVSKAKGDVPNQSSSFENLMAPYLSGQWPKDGQWQRETPSPLIFSSSTSCFSGAFTSDKQTQTPESWDDLSSVAAAVERRRSKSQVMTYKRSHSVGSGDQLKNIKHKLQRNGGHSAASPLQSRISPSLPVNLQSSGAAAAPSSQPIKIPVTASTGSYAFIVPPKGTPGKARSSVEGLNQEVEKLIICGTEPDVDAPPPPVITEDVEGHRAPIVELLTRSTDTQTPVDALYCESLAVDPLPIMLEVSEMGGERSGSQSLEASRSCSPADDTDRSQSVSPSFIPGHFELEEAPLPEETTVGSDKAPALSKALSSPCPNSEFMREPPDGAEKVKIIEETVSLASYDCKLHTPVSGVRLQPSARSAFRYVPLIKHSDNSAASTILVDETH